MAAGARGRAQSGKETSIKDEKVCEWSSVLG